MAIVMCDAESKRRFTRIDTALSSLTNDSNVNAKESSARMASMELKQAVMVEKHTTMIDRCDDLIVMFKKHMADEEKVFDKAEVRMSAIEGTIDRAKYVAIGAGFAITIAGTIIYNGFNATMKYLGWHG